MPPRKPLSSRASQVARRGGTGADADAPAPPGGPTHVGPQPEPSARRSRGGSGAGRSTIKDPDFAGDVEDDLPDSEEAAYETGSEYPAADEDLDPAASTWDADEDIYGEDDPYPDEEEELPSLDDDEPRRPARTRLQPAVVEDDDDDADDNATRAGPPIHVEVISGPDQGRVKRFRGVRMVIGRTQGCDFRLADGSVSRRHLELVLGDGGVLLRDLASGNGTKVNGEKVTEKVLEDGDEVALGQTRFRFVDELAALRKKEEAEKAAREAEEAKQAQEEAEAAAAEAADAEAPADDAEGADGGEGEEPGTTEKRPARSRRSRSGAEGTATQTNLPALAARRSQLKQRGVRRALAALEPRQRRIVFGAVGVFVLLIIGGIALSLRDPPAPPPDPRAEQAALKLQQARAAVVAHNFEEAISLAEAAEKLLPGTDVTGLAANARKELAAQRALDEVRALIREKKFEEARARLAQVTLAVVVGEGERKKVAEEIDAAIVRDARARAEAALDAMDPASAEQILQTLPRAEALALLPRLEQVKADVARAQAEEEKRQKVAAAAAVRRAQQQRAAHVDEAFAAVERKFHAGDFRRAVLECDHVIDDHRGDAAIRERARELKRAIPQFARYFDEGQRKFRSNNLSGAARPLRKAREQYRKIGFDGALGQIIDEQLSQASLAAGKASLARNDLASAVREFKDALELNPSETRARQGLETAYKRAEELYLEAYMVRDREPKVAASKFRIVLDVLPSENETHQKAQTHLRSMGH